MRSQSANVVVVLGKGEMVTSLEKSSSFVL